MNPLEYTIALSSALRANNLTHALYDILACVAKLEAGSGHATIPGVSLALGCTFNNIHIHCSRSSEFFQIDPGSIPRRLTLTPEAIVLLHRIKNRIETTTASFTS